MQTRRNFLKKTAIGAAMIPITTLSMAEDSKTVSVNEPMAKNFSYVLKAPEAKDNEKYKPGQQCSNCVLFVEASGGCNLFQGRKVAKEGWCKAWALKPGTTLSPKESSSPKKSS